MTLEKPGAKPSGIPVAKADLWDHLTRYSLISFQEIQGRLKNTITIPE